jgi:rubrerythrin
MSKEMSEGTKRLFSIFKAAIAAEQSAQAMYKEAAELCEDQPLKKILEGFYQDETRHERELLNRYALLRDEYGVQARDGG